MRTPSLSLKQRLTLELNRSFVKHEAAQHPLTQLFWECTLRCNMRCRHCGSDCKISTVHPDMPFSDFEKVLLRIKESYDSHKILVILSGGEPLMRDDLVRCGRQIRKLGFPWGLVSNGRLMSPERINELLKAGMRTATISLDGLEESHDWMRGHPDSYRRALHAISLAAREPRLNADVVTCVHRRNLALLPRIHGLLSGMGVKQWRLFTIIPIGRALQHDELHLDDCQLVTLMDFIAAKRRTRQTAMTVTFSCEGYLEPYECQVRPVPHFCHAGVNIASILADGTICACPNIDRHRFAQGNIHTDNLWEVWQTRFEPFRRRDWARQGACKDCRVFKNCLGGGMHNFHTGNDSPLGCHYRQIMNNQNPRP